MVDAAKDGGGHRRVREIVAVPGGGEGDVVEIAMHPSAYTRSWAPGPMHDETRVPSRTCS